MIGITMIFIGCIGPFWDWSLLAWSLLGWSLLAWSLLGWSLLVKFLVPFGLVPYGRSLLAGPFWFGPFRPPVICNIWYTALLVYILSFLIWGKLWVWVLFLYYEGLQIFQILPSPTHYRITTIEAIGRIVNTLEIHLDCTFYTTFVVHGQAQGVYELFWGKWRLKTLARVSFLHFV